MRTASVPIAAEAVPERHMLIWRQVEHDVGELDAL